MSFASRKKNSEFNDRTDDKATSKINLLLTHNAQTVRTTSSHYNGTHNTKLQCIIHSSMSDSITRERVNTKTVYEQFENVLCAALL